MSDHSYLKPKIAAQMPAAVDWFNKLTFAQARTIAIELGLDGGTGRLVSSWRDIVIESKAYELSKGK
jgi:hypothetical protein